MLSWVSPVTGQEEKGVAPSANENKNNAVDKKKRASRAVGEERKFSCGTMEDG